MIQSHQSHQSDPKKIESFVVAKLHNQHYKVTNAENCHLIVNGIPSRS